MLTCKQLVALSSDLLDAQLSGRQRLAVQVHLMMCGRCRRFVRQMRLSQQLLRVWPEPLNPDTQALAERLAAMRRERR
jgi:predicted anti-sigma-YlaC factor YlaD